MQVYRLFFKILRSQLGQVIMYICIFATITSIISGQNAADDGKTFKMSSFDIAVDDHDNSEASRALTDCLLKDNEEASIPDFDTETIQDELFNRNISAAVIIPEGYGAMISSGKTKNVVDVFTLNGTMAADIIYSRINNYIGYVAAFAAAGSSIDDATAAADDIINTHADVNVLDNSSDTKGRPFYFFSYLAYVFICIAFSGAAPILMVLNQENIRTRIACSSYKLSRINRETALALATFGIAICGVILILGSATVGEEMFTATGILYIINMLVYMTMSIGLVFFAGQLITSNNMVSIAANVIGLGFSFLGGVFVPLEYMSGSIVKIGQFLPSYWYITSCNYINSYTGGNITPLLGYLGVELIFAAVFFVAGLVAIKCKRG